MTTHAVSRQTADDFGRLVGEHMTSIRIAIAAALAVGALLSGSAATSHAAPAKASIAAGAVSPNGFVPCCD